MWRCRDVTISRCRVFGARTLYCILRAHKTTAGMACASTYDELEVSVEYMEINLHTIE